MWNYIAYRFPSKEVWEQLSVDNHANTGVDILVSGVLYAPPEEEGAIGDPIAGYHVSAAFRDRAPPQSWGQYEIIPPDFMPVIGRPPVPQSVSRFQARAALHLAGLLTTVESAIANSGNAIAQIAWADAVQFERNSPTIVALASTLNLTNAQIDDLFRNAAKISA